MNKKGSYIVETTITLPFMIIAVMVMSSIILMYACIEDANYIIATELRRGAAEAIYTNNSVLIPSRIHNRLMYHTEIASANLTDYRYLAGSFGQNNLIMIKYNLRISVKNPVNIASSAEYTASMVTRAYVGDVRTMSPMSEEDMAGNGEDPVYIFPSRGERYHNAHCLVLKAACKRMVYSSEVRLKYKTCPWCGSSSAVTGDLIYVFPQDGEAYHLSCCETLERNYVEVMRKTAIKRGYTACTKCGG